MKSHLGTGFWALVALVLIVTILPASAEPSVTSARIGHYGAATRLVIDLSEAAAFRLFTLERPDRVVIDMPPIKWRMEARDLPIQRGLVARLRYGQFRPDVSRIVIDLSAPATVDKAAVVALGRPEDGVSHRLVIDLKPTSRAAFAARAGAPADPPAFRPVAAARAPAIVPRPTANGVAQTRVAALRPPLPRGRPALGGRKIIVVDPGHGGKDPGAMTAGMREKDIALAMSRELRERLHATERYRVIMTRERDVYVPLRKRVAAAQRANADLFISVHADRIDDPNVGGASVYTLSDTASDAEAEELASRENKADIKAGVDLSEGYDEEVAQILISLIQQSTMNCSATFATLLVPKLSEVTSLLRHTHRFAGFRVLKAPDIPSVLVEFGFLSNVRDQAVLRSPEKRARLLDAVVASVDSYFSEPC